MAAPMDADCLKARWTLSQPDGNQPPAARRTMRPADRGILAVFAAALLSACQIAGPGDALSLRTGKAPVDMVTGIAAAAQKCWFGERRAAFAQYRLADEANSPAGRPRLLLVPKGDPTALPLLVIQAEQRGASASGTFTELQAYGPLLDGPLGAGIERDVKRWAGGAANCA